MKEEKYRIQEPGYRSQKPEKKKTTVRTVIRNREEFFMEDYFII